MPRKITTHIAGLRPERIEVLGVLGQQEFRHHCPAVDLTHWLIDHVLGTTRKSQAIQGRQFLTLVRIECREWIAATAWFHCVDYFSELGPQNALHVEH